MLHHDGARRLQQRGYNSKLYVSTSVPSKSEVSRPVFVGMRSATVTLTGRVAPGLGEWKQRREQHDKSVRRVALDVGFPA